MKTWITLIFILVVGAAAQAQNPTSPKKVETVSTSITVPATSQEIVVKQENSISVIYIYKHAKIKKALYFITARDKAKFA